MILKRIYDERLAQASYLVGCAATGEALVVDPNRDADAYLAAAAAERLRISHVTETHIHADYLSGTRELAARTQATMLLSGEGGEGWTYGFAAEDGAVLLRDLDEFRVGEIRVQAIHTPGHTPEHLSFLITDTATADAPMAMLTGDFVFVGDVGRPDLLERAAGVSGAMEAGARTLFRSLQALSGLPDYLQILPGHGAGSACGKGIGSVPSSTLGYERRFNWAFQLHSEDEFVEAVLTGQPDPPPYFARMKRVNRDGPELLGGIPSPARLPAERLSELRKAGARIVDVRPAAEFARGHVPGALSLPLSRSFLTWAGWLLPYDEDLHLLGEPGRAEAAARELALIGLDRVRGYFAPDAVDAWTRGGGTPARIPATTPTELAERLGADQASVLDVRNRSEWEAGHLPGVGSAGTPRGLRIPLGQLPQRLDEIPRDRPLVVHCQGGTRSAIAASLLREAGIEATDLPAGFAGWDAAGLPVERGVDAPDEPSSD